MSGSYFRFGKVGHSRQDITSAAGTTTLVNTSDYYQYVTGSTTQTIQLPDATTMALAVGFMVINANSAGNVTVTDNGSNVLATLSPGQYAELVVDSISTSNGVWMAITSGGGGSATVTYTATAGENLSANDAIYICSTTSDGSRTVGRAYKHNVTDAFRYIFAGFATAAASSGGSVTIQVAGELSGFSSIPRGNQIWGSTTTPGGFQTTSPDPTIYYNVPLGQGSTTTGKVLINGALGVTFTSTPPSETMTYNYLMGESTSDGATGGTTAIERLTISNESISTISATMPTTACRGAGSSSSTKGYCFGGFISGTVDIIQALTFSGETTATLGNTLPIAWRAQVNECCFQSSTKGYIIGGHNGAVTNAITNFVFSNETATTIAAVLSSTNGQPAGIASSTAGYSCGGSGGGAGSGTNVYDKLLFSNETKSTLAAVLSRSMGGATGIYSAQTSPPAGYTCGGENGSTNYTAIDKLLFSNESNSVLSATLSATRAYATKGIAALKGYIYGGDTVQGLGAPRASIDGLTFSNDACSVISATLSPAVESGSGVWH